MSKTNSIKTRVKRRCSGSLSNSCSTSGTILLPLSVTINSYNGRSCLLHLNKEYIYFLAHDATLFKINNHRNFNISTSTITTSGVDISYSFWTLNFTFQWSSCWSISSFLYIFISGPLFVLLSPLFRPLYRLDFDVRFLITPFAFSTFPLTNMHNSGLSLLANHREFFILTFIPPNENINKINFEQLNVSTILYYIRLTIIRVVLLK